MIILASSQGYLRPFSTLIQRAPFHDGSNRGQFQAPLSGNCELLSRVEPCCVWWFVGAETRSIASLLTHPTRNNTFEIPLPHLAPTLIPPYTPPPARTRRYSDYLAHSNPSNPKSHSPGRSVSFSLYTPSPEDDSEDDYGQEIPCILDKSSLAKLPAHLQQNLVEMATSNNEGFYEKSGSSEAPHFAQNARVRTPRVGADDSGSPIARKPVGSPPSTRNFSHTITSMAERISFEEQQEPGEEPGEVKGVEAEHLKRGRGFTHTYTSDSLPLRSNEPTEQEREEARMLRLKVNQDKARHGRTEFRTARAGREAIEREEQGRSLFSALPNSVHMRGNKGGNKGELASINK